MPMVDIAGKDYEVDEEGYLVDLSQWNEDVAKYMAVEEKVDLTESHWEVVNFLREYYAEYQIAPAVRRQVRRREAEEERRRFLSILRSTHLPRTYPISSMKACSGSRYRPRLSITSVSNRLSHARRKHHGCISFFIFQSVIGGGRS